MLSDARVSGIGLHALSQRPYDILERLTLARDAIWTPADASSGIWTNATADTGIWTPVTESTDIWTPVPVDWP